MNGFQERAAYFRASLRRTPYRRPGRRANVQPPQPLPSATQAFEREHPGAEEAWRNARNRSDAVLPGTQHEEAVLAHIDFLRAEELKSLQRR